MFPQLLSLCGLLKSEAGQENMVTTPDLESGNVSSRVGPTADTLTARVSRQLPPSQHIHLLPMIEGNQIKPLSFLPLLAF